MTLKRREFLRNSFLAGLALPTQQLFGFEEKSPEARIIDQEIKSAARNAELSMLFQGSTAAEANTWRKSFYAKLAELLGNFDPPTEWKVETVAKTSFDDHTRYELLLSAHGTPSVPVYLLIPSSASKEKPAPAVLCVHGHGSHGHHPIVGRTDLEGVAASIKSANYDYGLKFVRRGYVVAAPCMVPFGQRLNRSGYGRTDPCATTFVRLQALGQVLIAANLRDLRWSLDLLTSRPEVQADKIGCAGLSYGGRMTMLAAAIDERIKVAAVSGALNLLQERISVRYSCGAQIIPGLLNYGDYSEIGSLIAPRHCVWEAGNKDGLIKPDWASLFRERLERIYKAHGVSKNLQFDNFEGHHRWNGELAFPLFDSVLKS